MDIDNEIKEYDVSIEGIAHGIIYIYEDEQSTAYFRDIFVSENMRGKGFGSMLLDLLENIASKLNCKTFILKVEQDSSNHRWYERKGYTYLTGCNEDKHFIWMEKQI